MATHTVSVAINIYDAGMPSLSPRGDGAAL